VNKKVDDIYCQFHVTMKTPYMWHKHWI